MNNGIIKGSLLATTIIAGLAVSAPAFAQVTGSAATATTAAQTPGSSVSQPPAQGQPQTTSSKDEQSGEAIIVTGSRIKRTTFNSPDPISVITRDEATQAGFNSTAQILQSTAVTGGTAQINDSYGGFVVDGGPGVNTLSLRGLGATRTLILLNGRRVAPAGSRGSVGSADLNVLPNALIDRIEVLHGGASSIYGSDAVAGVVNIITRKKLNGISIEAQQNFPQLGAGSSGRYSISAGHSAPRWSVEGSIEYYKRDRLTIGDVPSLRCGTQRYLNGEGTEPGSGDFIDPRTGQPKCFPLEEGGVTVNTIGTGAYRGSTVVLAPGVPAGYNGNCTRFRPNPAVTTGALPGYECVGGGSLSLNIRDTSSDATLRQDVVSPAKIYTGYLSGHYDLEALGDAQVYGSILVNRRKSEQDGQRQFTIDYPVNSPLIPAALRARPLNRTIGIRTFADYGIYKSSQQQDFVKASVGLRGKLPFKDWTYDVYAGKDWSDASYTFEQILADRLAQSLNVVADPTAPSGFSCRVTTGGCVAAPALSSSVIGGQFHNTPWFDYVTDDVTGTTKYRETTYSADFNGSLFPIWGGDIKAAIGAEYRKSSIDDTPSTDSIRGNLFGFSSSTPTRGKDSVYELYGELNVPILKNVSFAKELSLDGSARYTHYKSYGGQKTYKIGGIYAPTSFLTFRGSYGTSYRAPALFEQFLGATSGFLNSQTDPCTDLASQPNPLITQRCLAEGLPADFVQNSGVTVIGLGGAAAGLKAETSKNLTYGAIFQHNFGDAIGDFSFAGDYFDIKVNNGVAQLSASSILSQCYENPQRTFCDTPFITRTPYTGPGTGALSVVQSYVNIASDRARGMDFEARYARRIGPGKLRIGVQATRMLKRYNQTLPTDDIVNLVGLTANPKWSGELDTTYQVGNFNFRYGVDYIGHTDDAKYLAQFGFTPDTYDYKVKDYYLHSASIRYETKRFTLTLGMRNIFDKKPPKITTDNPLVNTVSNVPIQGGYDFLGRTFFVNTRVSF